MGKVNLYDYLKRNKAADRKMVAENYTEWKKINTPVFDLDHYKANLVSLCRTILAYVNSDEIAMVRFLYPVIINGNTNYKRACEWTSQHPLTDDKMPGFVNLIVNGFVSAFGNDMAKMMPETMIAITVSEMSNGTSNQMYRYIDSLVDKPNGRNLINMDYVTVKNRLNDGEESGYVICIKTADFMDHFKEFNEIFA